MHAASDHAVTGGPQGRPAPGTLVGAALSAISVVPGAGVGVRALLRRPSALTPATINHTEALHTVGRRGRDRAGYLWPFAPRFAMWALATRKAA